MTTATLAAHDFPLTIRLFSGSTDELLWEKTVDRPANGPVPLHIPGYADTPHYPVRVEITFGDGSIYISGAS